MPKPYDTRLIMMVAQRPFDIEHNTFCKLIPLLYVDGVRADRTDFPNDGEVWWMLTARTSPLSEPGNLVIGSIEDASRFEQDNPQSSAFQATREAVTPLGIKDGVEVIDIGEDRLGWRSTVARTLRRVQWLNHAVFEASDPRIRPKRLVHGFVSGNLR